MTTVVVCDRCRRDKRDVPDVLKPTSGGHMVLKGADFRLPDGTQIDLCAECFTAALAWINLGDDS